MSIELKVKALSLAAETRIIKQQEQKCKQRSKRYYAYQLERLDRKMEAILHSIKNIEDSREHEVERRVLFTRLTQIRNRMQILNINLQKKQPSDEFVTKMNSQRTSLERHRIDVVRAEARATHIARGYLAGRSWQEMEGTKSAAMFGGWDRVYAMVMKYDTNEKGPTARKALFQAWLANIGIIHEERIVDSTDQKKPRAYQVFKKAA